MKTKIDNQIKETEKSLKEFSLENEKLIRIQEEAQKRRNELGPIIVKLQGGLEVLNKLIAK